MLHAVIDTNVIVSPLLVPDSKPAKVLAMALSRKFVPCFSDKIFQEYEDVLFRPKFPFSGEEIEDLLDQLRDVGLFVTSAPLRMAFADESDREFYEAAKFCGVELITGNLRHFPRESGIMTPAEFLDTHAL